MQKIASKFLFRFNKMIARLLIKLRRKFYNSKTYYLKHSNNKNIMDKLRFYNSTIGAMHV